MPTFHVLLYKNFCLVILGDIHLQNSSQRAAGLEQSLHTCQLQAPFSQGSAVCVSIASSTHPQKKESLDKNGEGGINTK